MSRCSWHASKDGYGAEHDTRYGDPAVEAPEGVTSARRADVT